MQTIYRADYGSLHVPARMLHKREHGLENARFYADFHHAIPARQGPRPVKTLLEFPVQLFLKSENQQANF